MFQSGDGDRKVPLCPKYVRQVEHNSLCAVVDRADMRKCHKKIDQGTGGGGGGGNSQKILRSVCSQVPTFYKGISQPLPVFPSLSVTGNNFMTSLCKRNSYSMHNKNHIKVDLW